MFKISFPGEQPDWKALYTTEVPPFLKLHPPLAPSPRTPDLATLFNFHVKNSKKLTLYNSNKKFI